MARSFGWDKKLRTTAEFSSVFHFRCTWRGALLEISAAPNGRPDARLGMIVPKRALPHATQRNRVKRLLREWFRQHQEQWAGLDMIARLRAGARTGAPSPPDESRLQGEFMLGARLSIACVARRGATRMIRQPTVSEPSVK